VAPDSALPRRYPAEDQNEEPIANFFGSLDVHYLDAAAGGVQYQGGRQGQEGRKGGHPDSVRQPESEHRRSLYRQWNSRLSRRALASQGQRRQSLGQHEYRRSGFWI